jgi:hypothetical protein
MKIPTVPGRDSFSAIGGIFGRDIGTTVDVVGLAHPVHAAALRHRLALLHDARAILLVGK